MYTMLMDERRSASGDRFVFTGVIVRSRDLAAIRTELRAAAATFAGAADAELKYVPDAPQRDFCRTNGLNLHDAKQEVFGSLVSRPNPDATVIVCVAVDRRGTWTAITNAEVYAWGYEMVIQRFARFLMEHPGDRADEGPNEVITDTLTEEPHRFHSIYASAYEDGWTWLPSPIRPLKRLAVREMLLSSVARYTPPLWLPDHVGGAVDDWIKVELQVDAADAGTGAPPRADIPVGARRRGAQLVPNFRSTAPGYSVAVWPMDTTARTSLSGWLRRVREQARADAAAART
jgi:hypothetical protein